MSQRGPKLKILESHPCSRSWDTMQGTVRQRHCEHCDTTVHNFAAMTFAEIEQLVREKEGHLCARIVTRADGSIRSLDGQSQPQPALAAGIALAASLAFSATAAAQTSAAAPASEKAKLTGTVLVPDGSGPAVGAQILLVSGDKTVAEAKTDANGNFEIAADPGRYDILLWQNVLFRERIGAADLHAGEQNLQPIRTALRTGPFDGTTTVGELEVTFRYPISYLFKHPLRYLKHLPHNF